MVTKKYLQDRVTQLKRELGQAEADRDCLRGERDRLRARLGELEAARPGVMEDELAALRTQVREALEARNELERKVERLTQELASERGASEREKREAALLAELAQHRAVEDARREAKEREGLFGSLIAELREQLRELRERLEQRDRVSVDATGEPVADDGESSEPPSGSADKEESETTETGSSHLSGGTEGKTDPLPQQLQLIEKFSGATPSKESFKEWVEEFEVVADAFHWSEHARYVGLRTRLRGPALEYYRISPTETKDTYEKLKARLMSRFVPVRLQVVQSGRFSERRQRVDESVDDYAQDLQRLFALAYPGTARDDSPEGMMARRVLASQFVTGLKVELKEKLTGVEGDVDQLIEKARFEETKRRELRLEKEETRRLRSGDSTNTMWTGSGQPRTSQPPSNTTTNLRRRSRGMSLVVCYNCGGQGHMSRSCPLKKRAEPEEATHSQDSSTKVRALSAQGTAPLTGATYQRSTTKVKVLNAEGVAGLETEMATMSTLEAREGRGERIGPRITVEVEIEGLPVTAVVDTGSPVSIISSLCLFDLYRRKAGPGIDWKEDVRQATRPPTTAISLKGYNSTPIGVAAEADLNLKRGCFETKAVLFVQREAPQELLIGTDLLGTLGMEVTTKEGSSLPMAPEGVDKGVVSVKLLKTTKLPARHMGFVPVDVSDPQESSMLGEVMFLPEKERDESLGVVWAPALVTVREDRPVVVEVRNESNSPVTLRAGTRVGHVESVEGSLVTEVSDMESADLDVSDPPCEGVHVNLLASITDADLARRAQLCEVLRFCELPVDLDRRDAVARLVLEFSDVFALTDAELGVTDRVCHHLDIGRSSPVKQYARRMPYSLRGPVEEAIKDMLERKIIRPSVSPWASPVVLVKKKEGSYRFCVDYRRLNALTKTDVYPLPRIEDYLDALSGVRYFSTLDLAARYWQVPMHPDSVEKTAFVSHAGSYEFLVMPFGLKNAPATFQRLMANVLAGLPQRVCMDYIDDILVVGQTFEEHLENLRTVLQRLREAGLKLKPSKCDLLKTEVQYLGYVVSADGIKIDPRKTQAVRDFPVPKNVRSLREFLGLTSYYRRFIDGYSRMAKPLYQLTKKDVPYSWSPAHQQAFERLKERLTAVPVLVYPNFTMPFLLETDASRDGLGAVLAQRQLDGTMRPIAYASRTIQGAEARYASSELEALGVVWATRHFRHYLFGHRCIVFTDNVALKSLLATPHPSGKLARWGLELQELDLTIQHRSRRENRNADALSRNPVEDGNRLGRDVITEQRPGYPPIFTVGADAQEKQWPNCEHGGSTSRDVNINTIHNCNDVSNCNNVHTCSDLPPLGYVNSLNQAATLREEQLQDSDLKLFFDYLEQGLAPEDEKIARRMAAEKSLYEIVDGVLFHVERDGTLKLIPPSQRRKPLITDLHGGVTGAHLGIEKTLGRARTHYWWESMRQDVRDLCTNCSVCRSRRSGRAPIVPLRPIPVGGPWECVGVDVLHLPQTRSGKNYLIVFQDYLTKWPEAFPTANQDTLTVARLLVERIVPVHGVPKRLLSDRGGCFLSQIICELYRLLNIQKLNTMAYHPKTDGMVERMNRTLIEMLSKAAHKDPKTWDLYLPYVLFAYRTSPHDSTQMTPFKLMYGREAILPTPELLLPPKERNETFLGTYVEEVTDKMSSIWKLAQQHISKAQAHQKASHDKKAKEPKFHIGDRVLLYSPRDKTGPLRKLALPNKGPYIITDISDTNVFVTPQGSSHAKTICVVWDRIRPCPEGLTSEREDGETQREAEARRPAGTKPRTVSDESASPWRERLRPRVRLLTVTTTRTSMLEWGRCNQEVLHL